VQAGRGVDLSGCNGSSAQRWVVGGDGTLRNVGLCLDIEVDSIFSGNRLVVLPCDGSNSQRWLRSSGLLVNAWGELCLDVPNFRTDDGTRLVTWGCNGGANQQWRLPG
jgi:hypothetical protein